MIEVEITCEKCGSFVLIDTKKHKLYCRNCDLEGNLTFARKILVNLPFAHINNMECDSIDFKKYKTNED